MESTGEDNCLNLDADLNYASETNFDYDFDDLDVVIRHQRCSSSYLLADGGDGAEADLLGTTPPRSRIRNKEIRKTNIGSELLVQKGLRNKKNENAPRMDNSSPSEYNT
ncbi:unnamed protein product [Diatraea saccharalis]|uniref:Uncharacterized protein n=1 Tax=Diatraea saccharalis TaxID=40085 RepID=A0A9N9WCM0_9NEOP|nr:unnamed protein product [Diatraea saccharalis]